MTKTSKTVCPAMFLLWTQKQINGLARGAGERMRTLLPDYYHFIAALIAAAALPSSCLNMCVYTLSVMAGVA
jgi:hypothetical protein